MREGDNIETHRQEKKELIPKEKETVRAVIVDGEGNILILRKSPKSVVAAGMYEFPGGNIDEIKGRMSTEEEQRKALIAEIEEETKLKVTDSELQKVEDYVYFFTTNNVIKKRTVNLFLVKINEVKPLARVGLALDKNGFSEDLHDSYEWVTVSDLIRLRKEGKLLGSTDHFEKVTDEAHFRFGVKIK